MTRGQGLHIGTLHSDDLLLRPFPVPKQLKALWILHSNNSLESAPNVPGARIDPLHLDRDSRLYNIRNPPDLGN